jgi:hypothetical protein
MSEREPGRKKRVETLTAVTPAVAESVKKTPKVESNRPRVPMIRKLIEVDGNLRSWNEFRRAEKHLASSHDVFNAKKKLRQIYGDDLQYKKIMAGLNKSGFNGWGRGIIQLEGCKGYLTVNKGKVKLYLPPIREDIKSKYDQVGQSRLDRSLYVHNLRSNSSVNRFIRWWSLTNTEDAKTVRMYDKEDRMRNASLGKDLSSIVAGKAGSYNTMSREDLLNGRFGVTSPNDSPRRAVEVRKWRSLGQYVLDKWQGNDRFTLDPNITYMASGSGAMKAAEKAAAVPDIAKKPEAKKKELTPPADTMKAKWDKERYAVDTVTDPVLNDHLNRVAEQHVPGVLSTNRHISVVARENSIDKDVVYYSMVDERGNRRWNLATPVGQQPTTRTQNAYRSTVQKFRQSGVTGISSSVEYADSARPADTFILSNAEAKGNLVQIIGIDANEKHPTNRVLVLGRESLVKKTKVDARDGVPVPAARSDVDLRPADFVKGNRKIEKFRSRGAKAFFKSKYNVAPYDIPDDQKARLDMIVRRRYPGDNVYLQDKDVLIEVPYADGVYYVAKAGPRNGEIYYDWVVLQPKDQTTPINPRNVVDVAVKSELHGSARGRVRLHALVPRSEVEENRNRIKKNKNQELKIEAKVSTKTKAKVPSATTPDKVPAPTSTPKASNDDALGRLEGYFATDAAPDNAAVTAAAPKADGVVAVAVDDRAVLGEVGFDETAAQDNDVLFDATPVPAVQTESAAPLLPDAISATVDVGAGDSSVGREASEVNAAIANEVASYVGGDTKELLDPLDNSGNPDSAVQLNNLIRTQYEFIAESSPLVVTMTLPSGEKAVLKSPGGNKLPSIAIAQRDFVFSRNDEILQMLQSKELAAAIKLADPSSSGSKPLAHIDIRYVNDDSKYVIMIQSQGEGTMTPIASPVPLMSSAESADGINESITPQL